MEITREQLAGAVETVRLRCTAENMRGIDWLSSVAIAERLLEALPGVAAGSEGDCRTAPLDDMELSFLAECVRRLDAMGDLAVGRCMAYLADRYPPE